MELGCNLNGAHPLELESSHGCSDLREWYVPETEMRVLIPGAVVVVQMDLHQWDGNTVEVLGNGHPAEVLFPGPPHVHMANIDQDPCPHMFIDCAQVGRKELQRRSVHGEVLNCEQNVRALRQLL